MKILAIYGSPRKGGNSDTLLDEFIRGAADAGAAVTKKYLRDMKIAPCTECGDCDETGVCIFDDDYQHVYNLIEDVDAMIVSSPVFFYGVTAIVKAFIDRSQQFWVRKNKLGKYEGVSEEDKKHGYFLSVGGTMGNKIFDGPLFNMKYFYDAIDFKFEDAFLFRGMEGKDDARGRQDVLKECYDAGMKAASVSLDPL
jgi:multimeric flavodoxin WrbA